MHLRNAALLLCGALPLAAQSLQERTRQALDNVLTGKYEAFYSLFNDEMKQAISLDTYSQQADGLLGSLGKPLRFDAPETRAVQGYTVVTIAIHWPAIALKFMVSWDQEGKIGGTWFRPAGPPPYERPAYSHPDSFTSREITVGDDQWKLPGTLTVPKGKGPFPAIVLVHGSGPNDRDESAGGVRVFRDLAEGLSSRGIAVLRYDKRTKVHPGQWTADPSLTMTDETVVDAVRALALARKQPEIDPARVFVLGHSQGGYMAPRIMKADARLAGAVVAAGNARPLEQVILDQNEYAAQLKGTLTDSERAQLEALRRDPSLALAVFPERYRADLQDYRPVALAMGSDIPMLILQGERDFQVTMKDFAQWKTGLEGRQNVTLRAYPGLNHLLVSGEGKSTPEEYENPAHVAPEVIADIAAWVAKPRK